mmetsp:Transcript_32163/g.92506  ORF Transcript_32163/g.92506 Transcript_32163/m.92506 type:complete len:204 (+) Transcript_32163:1146-1757(+)
MVVSGVEGLLRGQALELRGEPSLPLAELEDALRAAATGHDVDEWHHAGKSLGSALTILQLDNVSNRVQKLHRVGTLPINLQCTCQLIGKAVKLFGPELEQWRGEGVSRPSTTDSFVVFIRGRCKTWRDPVKHVSVCLLLPRACLLPCILGHLLGHCQLPPDCSIIRQELCCIGKLHNGLFILIQVTMTPGFSDHGLGVLGIEI